MKLPEAIRLEVEKSNYRDTILEVVDRLHGNGVTITGDVLAAIVATLEITEGVVE